MGELALLGALNAPIDKVNVEKESGVDTVLLSAAVEHQRTKAQTGCQESSGCSRSHTSYPAAAGKRKLPLAFSKPGPVLPMWPILNFCQFGKLVYATCSGEVEFYCSKLLEMRVQAVGFDIEWRATFRPGEAQRRTALVQLCYRNLAGALTCLLLQVAQAGMTPSLKELLISPAVRKAGVGIEGDAHKIARDFGFRMDGVYNLAMEAGYRIKLAGTHSLEGLTGALLWHRLPKDGGQRLSNWEAWPLSLEQQAYAATDAFASLRVYEELQALPLLPAEHHARQRLVPTSALPLVGVDAVPQTTASTSGQRQQKWIPAIGELGHLPPAPLSVYQGVFHQKLSVAEVARRRGVKEDTVLSYLAQAILAGYAFLWPMPELGLAALVCIARLAQQILEEPPILLDKPAVSGTKQSRKMPATMKKPAPYDDLAARLLKYGTTLGSFKAQLGDSLALGPICLGLAYLGRVGLDEYLKSLPAAQEPGPGEGLAYSEPASEVGHVQQEDCREGHLQQINDSKDVPLLPVAVMCEPLLSPPCK